MEACRSKNSDISQWVSDENVTGEGQDILADSLDSKPTRERCRTTPSCMRSSPSVFVSVAEEDDVIAEIESLTTASRDKGASVTNDANGEEEIHHEYTSLLSATLPARDSRYYGSLESTSSTSSSHGCDSVSSELPQTDETSDMSDESPAPSVKFTKHQWVVLLVLLMATLTSSFAVCLFPPFFPRLAEEKGASAAVYGFVIGTNCLTSFLVTPVIGKNLPNFGTLYSLVLGTFIGGICCGVSGFLEFFPPGWCFVLTSSLIRVIHATGNALVITATFTYAATDFNEAVGKIFSLTRTAMNLGQLLGPLVGGALYQVGGFYLPFLTMGTLQAAMGLISALALRELPVNNSESRGVRRSNPKKITILSILSIPTIWFSFVTFIVATICNGFLSINLEPKVLRRFHLSPLWIGLLFGIKDGANSLSSPVWGYLCDRSQKTSVKPYLIVSAVLVAASFFLMGACSNFGIFIELNLTMLIFLLCLNGIGIGGEQVVGVVDALHEAGNSGYPVDPAMHGIIAGLWSSLSGAGRFISRVGSGILVDYIGFDSTATIVTALQSVIGGLTLVYMIFCECSLKKQRAVRWRRVAMIESNNDEYVFADSTSPSDRLMAKSISIEIPKRAQKRSFKASRSVPYPRRRYRALSNSSDVVIARSLRHEIMHH